MKPYIVGFAGPSCSGKTTLCKETAKNLDDVVVISLDEYWNDLDSNLHVNVVKTWAQNHSEYSEWKRMLEIADIRGMMMGSSGWDSAQDVVVDNAGNIYVAGQAGGAIDGNTHWRSTDIIIVKYDTNGTILWTKQVGTEQSDSGYGIALNASGNVHLVHDSRHSLMIVQSLRLECLEKLLVTLVQRQ